MGKTGFKNLQRHLLLQWMTKDYMLSLHLGKGTTKGYLFENKGLLVSITQFTSIMETLSRTLDLMGKIKLLLTTLWSCKQNVKESSRHFNPGDKCIWQGFWIQDQYTKGNCISIHLQWVPKSKIMKITIYSSLKNKQVQIHQRNYTFCFLATINHSKKLRFV